MGPAPKPSTPGSVTFPYVCRLFPRHPGYVMTVCAETSDKNERRKDVIVRSDLDEEGMMKKRGSVRK